MDNLYNKIIGVLLLSFGIVTLIYPEVFNSLYGLEMPTSDSIAAIRTIIGGSEIALGLLFLIGPKVGVSNKSLSIIGASIFSSLVMARGYHWIIGHDISDRFIREIIAEAVIAAMFIFFICLYKKSIKKI